jgi:isochorismate hydrolase
MTAGHNGKSLWPLYHEYFFSSENAARHRDNLTEGAEGHDIYAGLDVQPTDIIATKSRFSAFLPTVSDLPEKLAAASVRNVVITGMLTNFCCETSARDAMMLDYRVAMVADANAARFIEDHNIGFSTVFQSFGDVVTTAETIGDLVVAAKGSVSAAI